MGDRTDTIAWPGPCTVNTHTIADPTTSASLLEAPPAAWLSVQLGIAETNYGNDAPFVGAVLDDWSLRRTDSGMDPHFDGDQMYEGETLPGHITLNELSWAYGDPGDNVPVKSLVWHELGHLIWWWLGFGRHSLASEAVWSAFIALRLITTQASAEVWAEDFKCLFGADVVRYSHGYASTLALPTTIVGLPWFIQRCKTAIDALEARAGFSDLSYQTPAAWGGKGYWIWTWSGFREYTGGDGIVWRWTGGAWTAQV